LEGSVTISIMFKVLYLSIFQLIFSQFLYSQQDEKDYIDHTKAYEPYYSILDTAKSPYAIPLGTDKNFASDLTINNEIVDENKLESLSQEIISQLQPAKEQNEDHNQNFWNPDLSNTNSNLEINSSYATGYTYIDTKDGIDGEDVLRVQIKNQQNQIFVIKISKYNFQEIVRTHLLKKIGYLLPNKKIVKNLELEFETEEDKNKFFRDFNYYIGQSEESKRWYTVNENKVVLHYVIIYQQSMREDKTDLSTSPILQESNDNKRIFRSLVAPFNITHMNTTSLNLMKWDLGRIESGNIVLDSPDTSKFGAHLTDLIWGTQQVANLNDQDWVDIVRKTELPGCVQDLLKQKYIERTKTLSKMLKIQHPLITTNRTLNCANEVLDGKQVQNNYEHFPMSFAYGNIQNPITQEEMAALLWSRLYQFGYQALVGVFNTIPYLNTDIGKVNDSKVNELIDDAIKRSKESGKNENIAREFWNIPFYRAGLIFDRQIVAGNFLGTTNAISIAETLGFRVGGGLFQGIAGILPDFDKNGEFNTIRLPFAQIELDAGATLTISHIEPVESVKAAFSEYKKNPFKKTNLVKQKNKLAKILKPAFSKEEIDQNAIDEFLNNFSINESIIINLQADIKAGASGRATVEFMQFDLGFRAQGGSIIRTHITRVNQNTIHVYKNNGHFLSPYIINTKGSAFLPILRYNIEKLNGMANTEFFSISVDPEEPNLKENVKAIYSVLKTGRVKKLYDLQKPYDLKFRFKENTQQMGLLMLSRNTLKQNLKVEIKDPQEETRKFVRTGKSIIDGINYYDYAADAVDSLIYTTTGWNPPLAGNYTFRPSNQIGGQSFVRSTTLEVETTDNTLKNPMVKLVRFYSGFKHKTKTVKKKLNKIFDHYHFNFFNDNILNGVDYLHLYQLEVEFNLYPEAIDSVLNIKEDRLKSIFKLHHNHVAPTEGLSREENQTYDGVSRFLTLRNKVLKKLNKNETFDESFNKSIIKLINFCDENLTLNGLVRIYGGIKNFYIRPKITGFRSGIEFDPTISSDRNIFGNTLGIVRDNNLGPLTNQLVKSDDTPGIVEGELFVQWILRRP
jgi:hypothetical protein